VSRRARAIALERRRQPPSLLPWIMFALMLTAAVAAHAQGAPAPSGRPEAQTTPPEIVRPGGSGVSGSSHYDGTNGVIAPPASVDPGMPVAHPDPGAFSTPMVRPPGTPGGDPKIVPK
jgi:hypothetical protein